MPAGRLLIHLPERYRDKVVTDGGLELYTTPAHEYATEELACAVRVMATCEHVHDRKNLYGNERDYEILPQVGDLILIRYRAIFERDYIDPVEKMMVIPLVESFAILHEDGRIKQMLGGYVNVQPLQRPPRSQFLILPEEKDDRARVLDISHHEQVQPDDVIAYTPPLEKYRYLKEDYHLIHQSRILGIFTET